MTSRLQQVLNAKERLPSNLKQLFELLYERGFSEEEASVELHCDINEVRSDRRTLIRSLRSPAACVGAVQ